MKKLFSLTLVGLVICVGVSLGLDRPELDKDKPDKLPEQKIDRLPRLKRAGATILYELTVRNTPLPPDVFLDEQKLFTDFFTDEGTPSTLEGDEYAPFRKAFEKKEIGGNLREPFLASVWIDSRLGTKAASTKVPLALVSVGKTIDDMVKLKVTSDPNSASLYLMTDLNFVGYTPHTEWVFPGKISVFVKKSGCLPDAQELDVTGDYEHKVVLYSKK